MGLTVIPTNIGGTSINSLAGPLAALFNPSTPATLVYPADLASNPAMNHAIQFEIYDYHTTFGDIAKKALVAAGDALESPKQSIATAQNFASNLTGEAKAAYDTAKAAAQAGKITPESVQAAALGAAGQTVGAVKAISQVFQAPTYKPQTKSKPLATISLFMPETLAATYDSNYSQISMTEQMGLKGLIANGISDTLNKNPNLAKGMVNGVAASVLQSEAAKNILAFGAGTALGTGTQLLQQAQNQFTNPQLQLLYNGIELRTFTLEFIFTPKSSQEAESVNNIIDSFTFYSVPGIVGAGGNVGQYLTPPQLFKIRLAFLGKNGIGGQLSNIFSSALNNIGLGFLNNNNPTGTITSAPNAKIMTINECVLDNVNVDYAPNGWAAYNDGYPIQTRLTLTFRETNIITKDSIKNRKIQDNYQAQQQRAIDERQFVNSISTRD